MYLIENVQLFQSLEEILDWLMQQIESDEEWLEELMPCGHTKGEHAWRILSNFDSEEEFGMTPDLAVYIVCKELGWQLPFDLEKEMQLDAEFYALAADEHDADVFVEVTMIELGPEFGEMLQAVMMDPNFTGILNPDGFRPLTPAPESFEISWEILEEIMRDTGLDWNQITGDSSPEA